MERITLRRTGSHPLTFLGDQLAEVSGFRFGDREQSRWHELALYRTESGRHVLSIGFRTRWQGEVDHDEAHHADTSAEVLNQLTAYDPLAHIAGYPPGEAYIEKQRRLEDDICRRWNATITALYDQLPVGWAEEVA